MITIQRGQGLGTAGVMEGVLAMGLEGGSFIMFGGGDGLRQDLDSKS